MKNFLILLGILALAGALFAQPEVIWSTTFGGNGNEQGLAVMETADGNICVSGNEGSFGGGGTDGCVIMVDLEGDEIWSVNYGGIGYDRFYSLIQVEDGFVTGGYTGSIGAGQFDYWLFKMDEEGDQVWSRSFGGRDFERSGTTVQTTNGGFAMVGNTLSFGAGGSDGWLVVTDEDGQQDWTAPYGGNGEDYLSGAVSIEDGGFVLAGRTGSEGEGGLDAWLFQVNNEGEEIWSHTYGGDEDDNILSMKQTSDGGYIMAGYTASFAEDGSDFWLIKTDEDGEEIWSRTYDQGTDEQCRDVIQTFDGGYLMGGCTWAHDDQRCDALLVRTDDEGEVMWIETYGGNQPDDVITGIVQIPDGGYVFTGWTASFGAGGWDVWLVRLGPEPAGVLEGFVLDAEDDSPLEGASITTTNGCNAETDEDGFFRIDPVWAGDFDVTASLQGYNDQTFEDLNTEEDDTVEVIFQLTHPEFEPSRRSFEEVLEPDDWIQIDFTGSNDGNGPLTYTVDRRLLGAANADPWSLRDIYDIEDIVEDDQLNGVVFVDGCYYVSGGNNGEDINKIYIFDAEGDSVGEFDQFVESHYGMRDLTWDSRLIWGADGTILYGLNTDGELIETIEGGARSYRSLTWDAEHQVFWSADINTDIYSTDLEGNTGDEIEVPGDIRIYGLSYWAEDPDGYNLYIFSRGDEDDEVDIQVNKINVDTGEITVARALEVDGRPGGIFITNCLDIYSWVLIGIVQGPDRLAVWQLEARREWFQVEPADGVIHAEDTEDFTLTLDATGLPPDNRFEGEIVFMHNAIDAETALSVTLQVVEGGVPTSRELELTIGWNLVSVNLQPDSVDVEFIMADIVENDLLEMMKDGAGHFYRPDANFNNIPGWFVDQGYQIKMRDAARLRVEGLSVLHDEPIDLEEGWQIVSYYPRIPVEATLALRSIEEHLVIAKDGFGNFYVPEWNFSNIGDMREGQGYYVNVDEDVRLIYTTQEEEGAVAGGLVRHSSVYNTPGLLPIHQVTGSNMSLLVMESHPLLLQGGSKGGCEIGVYAAGKLVGSGVLQNGVCGIAVWGDDPSTEAVDGALEGHCLDVKLLDENGIRTVEFDVLAGEAIYSTDALAVIQLDDSALLPNDFAITSAYPNPFNSVLRVGYSLPEAADVALNVYDLSGRLVAELVSGRIQAGVNTVVFDGSGLASGVYVLRYEAASHKSQMKVVLIK